MSVKKVSQPPPPQSDDSDSDSVASEAVCPPVVDNKKRWKGKAKWQEFGYESEADMMSDGIYSKGDTCVKCGKVFGRKYAKRLHDDRCNGTIKRCGNSKAPSKSKSAFIKSAVDLCEMLDQPALKAVYSALSIEGIEDYIATGKRQAPQNWARALGLRHMDNDDVGPDVPQDPRFFEVKDTSEIDSEIEAVIVGKFRDGFRKWRNSAKVKSERVITFGSRKIRKEDEYALENFIADHAEWAEWVIEL